MVAKQRKMVVIRSNDKDSFVKSYNSSLPNKEFRDSCAKAGELFSVSNKKTDK